MLQLDGNNTFTGATAIQTGALAGIGTLASTVTMSGSAHLAPGDSGPGTLTLAGLTLNNNSIVDLDLGSSSDLIVVNGTLTLAGATVNVTDAAGFGANTYEIMSYGSLGTAWSPGLLTVGTLPAGFSAVIVNTREPNQS